MDIINPYSLFHPNYLASKRDQIKLDKLLKLSSGEIKAQIFKPNKLKIWRVENKNIKKYVPQDSKYNFKQVVKNFKLNREQLKHGYSNKYIDLFTDLLYKNNLTKYPKKRLSLVDFRKKVLKKKINTSFEEFIQKEPLSDRYNFSKQNLNNVYLTTIIQKCDKDKSKLKSLTIKKEKKDKKDKNNLKVKDNNRVLLKEFLSDSNLNDNKYKLRLNIKNIKNKNQNNYKKKNYSIKKKIYEYENSNLQTPRDFNNTFSELNILFKSDGNDERTINNYTYKKDDDENIYFGKLTPKEEFVEGRNKAKYIDYLRNKYNFYTYGNIKDLKNYSEIKKRQILFSSGNDKIEYPIDYPYKKEFFKRYNRLYSKNNIKLLINEEIKNITPIKKKNFFKKKKN